MTYCGHCAKEIEKVANGAIFSPVYNHIHSGQHLCDKGGTGAHPVNNLYKPDSKAMIAWKKMRKQVEADEAAEKKLDEQAEYEDNKEYEYLR